MDKVFNNLLNFDFEMILFVYQGVSDDFCGLLVDVEFLDEVLMIDMEGEFGVIIGDVVMGLDVNVVFDVVCLFVQINDWLFCVVGVCEMCVGFGFFQVKFLIVFVFVVVMFDEFGVSWSGGWIKFLFYVVINGCEVGCVQVDEMYFFFGEIIVYCVCM